MTSGELEDFAAALADLASVLERYKARAAGEAVLVGGGAVITYLAGSFFSGDFDVVASDMQVMDECMRANGFIPEHRPGRLWVGWHHPQHPTFATQVVSGSLFDGRADPVMSVRLVIGEGLSIVVASPEDLIADRLAQQAVASPTDASRLLQAVAIARLVPDLVWDYLERRTREEDGDLSLLMLPPPLPSSSPWPSERRTRVLRAGWREAAQRARDLDLDMPALTEALRNGGERRTEAKRELLRAIQDRAARAGVKPARAIY